MSAKKASQGKAKASGAENPNDRLIARNRKARHDYEILETYEAGMVLVGTEVKSLRDGRVNLTDSYAEVRDGEVFLRNLHISAYTQGNRFNHEPLRVRKLLLNRREIRKLIGRTVEKGLTLVPLSLYFKRGRAKCELGLARGKKSYDKRASKADADAARKIQQALRGGMRRGRGGDDA
jgi:SsrA-binding protein